MGRDYFWPFRSLLTLVPVEVGRRVILLIYQAQLFQGLITGSILMDTSRLVQFLCALVYPLHQLPSIPSSGALDVLARAAR